MLKRDGFTCQIRYAKCKGVATEADHIRRPEEYPAGEYDPANVRAACKSCNVAKRNKELAARAKRAENPRQAW